MRALVYTANQEITYREEPDPVPNPGEVVVRVEAVGICGSDMHAYVGHDPRRVPPLILGHEAAGTVVGGSAAGRRAVLNPLITCGRCNECLGGRSNICAERDLIGMYRPGAFAEFISIPESNLIDIPEGMEFAHAALTEPAGTALHAVRLAAKVAHRPLAELTALVFGAGSVGLFAALALKHEGIERIALAETNALRRETANDAKVGRVFNPLLEAPAESAFDVIIDAVGGKATRAAAMTSVRPGGVVMHVGLMDNHGGFDARRITLQEITVIGTYTYTLVDLCAAVDGLHGGAFGDLSWVEQRTLKDGPRAFDDLLHGRSAAPKIVLRP